MDVETYDVKGELRAYCISWYDGVKYETFYLTDYSNHKELLEKAVKAFLIRKMGDQLYISITSVYLTLISWLTHSWIYLKILNQ